VIALSKQQMVDLDNGMQMTLTSSTPSSGASHTHTWSLQGGNVLYDKNCYNCHSNDNRGRNPMNVSFNSSQTNAVKSPGSAPISSTPAAIPDPNYTQTSETTVNAAAVYAGLCAGCHSLGTVDTVTGIGPNLSGKGALVSGKFPTPGVISHNGQSLTAAQISAMIIYFNAN
jgi:mono/diheme cytochrome c family protein